MEATEGYRERAMLADDRSAANNSRPFGTQPGPERTLNGKGTLDQIFERIMRNSMQAKEIGHKLNQHADAVHGPQPTDGRTAGIAGERDLPSAALDRIYMALDDLDRSQSYMAEAAGRNSTLA